MLALLAACSPGAVLSLGLGRSSLRDLLRLGFHVGPLPLPPSLEHTAATTAPASATAADLLHLFDRPAEPVFTLRGVNRDVAYDVPVEYLVSRR